MTGSPPSITAVREGVRKRVDETSLRDVADEIGMSWSGLKSFLDGRRPQRRTIGKLVAWYYSRSKRSSSASPEDVEAAIAVVRGFVREPSKPTTVQERRLREIIDRLRNDAD
jgi:hypothetical protein